MKKISVTISLLFVIIGCSNAQPTTTDTNNFDVTLFSNGYVYPKTDNWNSNNISKQGLTNWSDATSFTRTFFYPLQAGKIQVALKLRSLSGNSKLSVQLDSAGKSYEVSIKESSDFITVPVGDLLSKMPVIITCK